MHSTPEFKIALIILLLSTIYALAFITQQQQFLMSRSFVYIWNYISSTTHQVKVIKRVFNWYRNWRCVVLFTHVKFYLLFISIVYSVCVCVCANFECKQWNNSLTYIVTLRFLSFLVNFPLHSHAIVLQNRFITMQDNWIVCNYTVTKRIDNDWTHKLYNIWSTAS